jgi:hypothetical protein
MVDVQNCDTVKAEFVSLAYGVTGEDPVRRDPTRGKHATPPSLHVRYYETQPQMLYYTKGHKNTNRS